MELIEELLTRGVANIIPSKEELEKKLRSGKTLNIYIGIDPTVNKIHLGHTVALRKLQLFAELGHQVTFLIGDFTTLVGDTSDKESERPILTKEEIEENFKEYKQQAKRILDFTKVTIKHNSQWLKDLNFAEIIHLTQQFSVNDFIGRELIRKRLHEGKRIRLDEVLYPIMQGYDSYVMNTDLQLGGTDQTFNMQAGRTLQKILRQKESFVMTNEFLSGTDGRKMSKSWGNAIWLTDTPKDIYAKTMAINDDLIIEYFTLGTNLAMDQVKSIQTQLNEEKNPMKIKKQLAYQIVKELHSENDAQKAQDEFEKTVQRKELPEKIEQIELSSIGNNTVNEDLLLKLNLVDSKNEAKRLFQQGAVTLNNEKIRDSHQPNIIKNNSILKIGKRKIVKFITT